MAAITGGKVTALNVTSKSLQVLFVLFIWSFFYILFVCCMLCLVNKFDFNCCARVMPNSVRCWKRWDARCRKMSRKRSLRDLRTGDYEE